MAENQSMTRRVKFTSGVLKEHFGLPPVMEILNSPLFRGWIDHEYICHVTRSRGGASLDRYEFISEPYNIGEDELANIVEVCKQFNLHCVISGGAQHNASCFKIILWRGDL